MTKSKRAAKTILKLFIVTILCCCWMAIASQGDGYTERDYALSELSDGVYGWYNRVSSQVPAQNYDVITLCCDGVVVTFQGEVYITYTTANPHVVVKDSNFVNSDEIYVYVPQGTISFRENVGI